MLDSGEAAKNREIQPEATFDLISNPGSERGNSNPRMQIALFYMQAKLRTNICNVLMYRT